MGTVLVSLDEDHEALLRQLAQEKYGSKKGSVSAVVEEALDSIKKDDQKFLAKERLKKRLKQGLDFRYKMYQKRSEIYD